MTNRPLASGGGCGGLRSHAGCGGRLLAGTGADHSLARLPGRGWLADGTARGTGCYRDPRAIDF